MNKKTEKQDEEFKKESTVNPNAFYKKSEDKITKPFTMMDYFSNDRKLSMGEVK